MALQWGKVSDISKIFSSSASHTPPVTNRSTTPNNGHSQNNNTPTKGDSKKPFGIFAVLENVGHVFSLPCLLSDMEKGKKQFFMFYIYTWCFGLALGIAATVLCFVDDYPTLSKATILSAVILSVVVGLSQIALNTLGKENFSKICVRRTKYALRMSGLVVIMAGTLTGTVSYDDVEFNFIICTASSFSCYLFVLIGFLARSFRRYRYKKSQRKSPDGRTGSTQMRMSPRNVKRAYSEFNETNFEPLPTPQHSDSEKNYHSVDPISQIA